MLGSINKASRFVNELDTFCGLNSKELPTEMIKLNVPEKLQNYLSHKPKLGIIT